MMKRPYDRDRARTILALALLVPMAAGCRADHTAAHDPATDPVASVECGINGFPAPTLCARSGVDSILDHATHIVMLDESESMVRNREGRNYWIPAIEAIRTRRRDLPPTARMELYLFAGHVTHRGEVTEALVDSLRRTAPRGLYTHLGRAAEAAVNETVAHPIDRPLFISFLTDGEHDPPPGSPYDTGCSGSAWRELVERSANATSQRPVLVDFVRIGDRAAVGCLHEVFPDARVCNASSPDDIARCVAWGETQMAIRYIEWLFAKDTSAVAGTIRTTGTLATTGRLPATVGLLAEGGRTLVDTCWDSGAPLPKGGTLSVRGCLPAGSVGPVALDGVIVNGSGRWYDWFLPAGVRPTPVAGNIALGATFEPSQELLDIGLPARRPNDAVAVELHLAAGGRVRLWGYILIVLGIALLVGLVVWMLLPPIPPKIKPLSKLAALGYAGRIDLERCRLSGSTYALPMPGATSDNSGSLIVELRRKSRWRGRKDVVIRVHLPETEGVQLGIISKKAKSMRLRRIHGSTDLELPGVIVWDPPAVRWDDQLTYREVCAICVGYEVKAR
jgi:hypothetical protein